MVFGTDLKDGLSLGDPIWFLENQLGLPVYIDGVGDSEVVMTLVYVIRFTINLADVFTNPDKRKYARMARPLFHVGFTINFPIFNFEGTRPVAISTFGLPIFIFLDSIFPEKYDYSNDYYDYQGNETDYSYDQYPYYDGSPSSYADYSPSNGYDHDSSYYSSSSSYQTPHSSSYYHPPSSSSSSSSSHHSSSPSSSYPSSSSSSSSSHHSSPSSYDSPSSHFHVHEPSYSKPHSPSSHPSSSSHFEVHNPSSSFSSSHHENPSHSSYSAYERRRRRDAKRGSWSESLTPELLMEHCQASTPHCPASMVLGSGRSLGADQSVLYRQVEASLSGAGLDGESCLKKAVCEAQGQQLLKLSLFGHLITAFLSPVEEDDNGGNEVKWYRWASELGRSGADCSLHFPLCSISILDIFKFGKNSGWMGSTGSKMESSSSNEATTYSNTTNLIKTTPSNKDIKTASNPSKTYSKVTEGSMDFEDNVSKKISKLVSKTSNPILDF